MEPQALFPVTTYQQRRQALTASLDSGLVLLLGLEHSAINYADNWYPFRQDSSFLYYFGLNRAGLAAAIDIDSGQSVLFGDDATLDETVWTGTQTPLARALERIGADRLEPADALGDRVAEAIRSGRRVHTLPPYRAQTRQRLHGLGLQRNNSLELVRAVVGQRQIKSAEEVADIERAVAVSAQMHLAALRGARPGRFEYEVVAEMQRAVIGAGMRTSFPIIASIRGETLHNHSHHRRLESGQLFLSDAGAETTLGYAGDLSRTGPVDPTFTAQQREVYDVALSAHQAAIAAVRPGIRFVEVHKTACRTLVEGLISLGLMQGEPAAAVEAGAHALFFPCGTGHMMGLDVHDMEGLGEDEVGYSPDTVRSRQFGLRSLRLAKELETGFVLTVEPGLYFIPDLIDGWQSQGLHRDFIRYSKLQPFRGLGGMRSEDNLLVTRDGYRVLGPGLPTRAEDIERLKA